MINTKSSYSENMSDICRTLPRHVSLYIWNSKLKRDIYNPFANEYNKLVDDLIQAVSLLKWNDYYEFSEVQDDYTVILKKIGIPEFYNNIHNKDDCKGKITIEDHRVECHLCSDWFGCTDYGDCRARGSYRIYQCDKCNYTYKDDR